jgi:hypothetical protein
MHPLKSGCGQGDGQRFCGENRSGGALHGARGSIAGEPAVPQRSEQGRFHPEVVRNVLSAMGRHATQQVWKEAKTSLKLRLKTKV